MLKGDLSPNLQTDQAQGEILVTREEVRIRDSISRFLMMEYLLFLVRKDMERMQQVLVQVRDGRFIM